MRWLLVLGMVLVLGMAMVAAGFGGTALGVEGPVNLALQATPSAQSAASAARLGH